MNYFTKFIAGCLLYFSIYDSGVASNSIPGITPSFNGNQIPQEVYDLEWTGSSWDSLQKGIFLYNSNNQLSIEIAFQKTGSIWDTIGRTTYSYTTFNKILGIFSEQFNSGIWTNTTNQLY